MTTSELPRSRRKRLPSSAIDASPTDGSAPALHAHLVDLLDAVTLGAVAAGVTPGAVDGLRAELARKLDEHYFDVRRCIGRKHRGSFQDERSIDHLTSALHHLQVMNDLAAARHHLVAHVEECPLSPPTTTDPPPREMTR